MPVVSDSALAHADDSLTPAARLVVPLPDRREEELTPYELRQAFCAHLRAARERRGVDLQCISDATKVSESLFSDLERGNLSRWPSGIYRRSFFREYAMLIGLPGESTVSEFVRLFPEDLETGDALVRGPLRLTLARPFWRRISWRHVQAACLDLIALALLTAGLQSASGLGLWTSLALVGLSYQIAGTTLVGGSLGRWLLQARVFRRRGRGLGVLVLCLLAPAYARAQSGFQPEVGQPGKDVVWVPTPYVTVERMLDLAQVTSADYVIDLGSGDGRNVIEAARRGASALGVEYNPDMVALSRRLASEAGVSARATFVQGDMFQADISKADVLALFLLPSNLLRLRSKFYDDLRPGTRIVSNTFTIQDWDADESVEVADCDQWCTVHLYIVPAKIGGQWKTGSDWLELKQDYQMLSGTLTSGGQTQSVFGQLRGTQVSFKAGGRAFTGQVVGREIVGTVRTGETTSPWRATRE